MYNVGLRALIVRDSPLTHPFAYLSTALAAYLFGYPSTDRVLNEYQHLFAG